MRVAFAFTVPLSIIFPELTAQISDPALEFGTQKCQKGKSIRALYRAFPAKTWLDAKLCFVYPKKSIIY